mmetsp:Transcript_16266/g.54713  ORF Transcript_16266/g.54713 Transcript_16266/m.54713 type:complete len:212 (+) Transcript_16266:196-831(+)
MSPCPRQRRPGSARASRLRAPRRPLTRARSIPWRPWRTGSACCPRCRRRPRPRPRSTTPWPASPSPGTWCSPPLSTRGALTSGSPGTGGAPRWACATPWSAPSTRTPCGCSSRTASPRGRWASPPPGGPSQTRTTAGAPQTLRKWAWRRSSSSRTSSGATSPRSSSTRTRCPCATRCPTFRSTPRRTSWSPRTTSARPPWTAAWSCPGGCT